MKENELKTVSNEEKAKEIAEQYEMSYNNTCDLLWLDLENVALQAMRWKDEQHEQENQQWIDKAAEWVEKYLFEIGFPDDWLRDSVNTKNGKTRFIQAMKGE